MLQPLQSAEHKIKQAMSTLIATAPFFAVLALQLKQVADPSCKTMWTDGVSLGYNPTFVESLPHDVLTFALAHEGMHCAGLHPFRRGAREHKRWNHACDYAINGILKDAGFRLWDQCLIDPQFAGKNAEWIYDRLPEGSNGSSSGDQPGEVRDAPADAGKDGSDKGTAEGWERIARTAKQVAKAHGNLPAGMSRSIDTLLKPRVDWQSVLRRYITEIVAADYTWTMPNKRYIAHGIYLPALRSVACGPIVFAADSSGSVDDVTFAQFMAEGQGIVEDVQPSHTRVMVCDASIHVDETFERGERIDGVQFAGGGGTDFRPVFDAVNESDEHPACLVYLTDLEGSFPSVEPAYPVIWCVVGGQTYAPFGDVIPVE